MRKKGLYNVDENPPIFNKEDTDVLHSISANITMGRKEGKNRHRAGNICPMYQGDQKHCGVKSKIKARTTVYETKNKQKYNYGSRVPQSLVYIFDDVHGVHPDTKNHNGGSISFGCRLIHFKSSKQKLNTKSSTESKVVGVSDYLPYNIWVCVFIEDQ